jgi:hypothetical protein
MGSTVGRLFFPPCHQSLMAFHTKYSLTRSRMLQVFDLLFTIAALETIGTEGLIAGQDGEILDLVVAAAAAVGAGVADECAVAEEE